MGAWMTEQVAAGKTAGEAFGRAVRDAASYYGHQEGYSGAINSGGSSFVKVALPKGCTYQKFQGLLEEAEYANEVEYKRDNLRYLLEDERRGVKGLKGRITKARREVEVAKKALAKFVAKVEKAGFYFPEFERLADTYNDKWGDYLCIELTPHLAKKNYPHHTTRRGERLYIFFGYAPS